MRTPIVIVLACFSVAQSGWAMPQTTSAFPEGERIVYSHVVEAFHHGNLPEIIKQRQILERNYPLSVHLDSAYFLTGKLEYQQNNMGEALKAFDVVRDRYAKSIRRPSALFGIGMTFERLNLTPQAHRVFASIMREYPGSPEAQRAWMNMRVENQGSKPALKKR